MTDSILIAPARAAVAALAEGRADVPIDFGDRPIEDIYFRKSGDWRYLYRVVHLFNEAGRRVAVRTPFDRPTTRQFPHYRRLCAAGRVGPGPPRRLRPAREVMYLRTAGNAAPIDAPWGRRLVLNFDESVTAEPTGADAVVPFGMHPNQSGPSRRGTR